MFDPLAWLAGSVLTGAKTRLLSAIAGVDPLRKALLQEIAQWADRLPGDLVLHPEAMLAEPVPGREIPRSPDTG